MAMRLSVDKKSPAFAGKATGSKFDQSPAEKLEWKAHKHSK